VPVPRFKRFVGIDWSGEKKTRPKGIQVAVCETGSGPPLLMAPPTAAHWSRAEICGLIAGFGDVPTLVGIDFAFAYAFADRQAYFPGFAGSPHDAAGLWAFVEAINQRERDLYGAALYRDTASPVRDHYWTGGVKPAAFVARRRVAEMAAAAANAAPHPVFKVFSSANVGTGSLAGMRLLHRVRNGAAIWPFADPGDVTVVEIYPKFFVRRAKVRAERLVDDISRINATLASYGSEAYAGPPLDTEDKVDAVISAAALRALAADPDVWDAPAREPASRLEGWIFGVT
jgi:hypothetical protein